MEENYFVSWKFSTTENRLRLQDKFIQSIQISLSATSIFIRYRSNEYLNIIYE